MLSDKSKNFWQKVTKIRVSKIRVRKIRVREIRVREIRVREIRVNEIRVNEIRVREIRVREIRVSKIRVREIRISSNRRELHGAIFTFHGGDVLSASTSALIWALLWGELVQIAKWLGHVCMQSPTRAWFLRSSSTCAWSTIQGSFCYRRAKGTRWMSQCLSTRVHYQTNLGHLEFLSKRGTNQNRGTRTVAGTHFSLWCKTTRPVGLRRRNSCWWKLLLGSECTALLVQKMTPNTQKAGLDLVLSSAAAVADSCQRR